ncbi:response regulator [Candidatus Saganbacteria bacterium]|nr:response regulator [Candidatus Saganbacteria bacterium]
MAAATLAAAQITPLPGTPARTYLPGDFVQVIVEAPVDTAQITALMPDGTVIGLVQQRRTNVWRGIWQVPINFKAGDYAAKLQAVDLEGNIFEGQTDNFTIGALAMITLVGKPTVEAAPTRPIQQTLKTEQVVKETGQVEKTVTVAPSAAPAPDLSPRTRQILIEKNLDAGKGNLTRGNLASAAANFRIVLYLSPDHEEASSLLADTQQKLEIQRQEAGRRNLLIWAISLIAVLVVIALVFYLAMVLTSWRVQPAITVVAPSAPPPLTKKEQESQWCGKAGWKNNPFTFDIFKEIFTSSDRLEVEGLKAAIRGRIESVGGKGIDPFTDSAIDQIHALSHGKLKAALKICDWAVERAIEQGSGQITAEIVKSYEKIGLRKILVADDEEIIRASLEAILKKAGGYEVDLAIDGEEALKKIKENLYGAVLLDIEMPKLDGYEILKQVRPLYPDLPIIFVTGKGMPEKTMESLTQFNLTGYIEKPFTPEKVLDTVARALK